jgi:hypothetical protein
MNGSAIGIWLVAGVLGSMLTVQAASVTLAWDLPSPSTEVTGYKLHYGPAGTCDSEDYTEVIDVHNVTQFILEGLTAGTTYVFAVRAYGDNGKMSDFSNKICHFAAAPEPTPSFLDPPTIMSPAVGVVLATGQQVTAEGRGTNLSWSIDRIGDGLPAFATGSGSSITFTVPADATSHQKIRMLLAGEGGSDTKDYDIKASPAD